MCLKKYGHCPPLLPQELLFNPYISKTYQVDESKTGDQVFGAAGFYSCDNIYLKTTSSDSVLKSKFWFLSYAIDYMNVNPPKNCQFYLENYNITHYPIYTIGTIVIYIYIYIEL